MAFFGLGSVAYFGLLLINAVAILNKERFLVPLGLTTNSHAGRGPSGASGTHSPYHNQPGGYNQYDAYGQQMNAQYDNDVGLKARLVTLVDAVRTLMRIPLIPINIVVILYELILG
ncbi:hypothetical protein OIO90_004486 [Microbotryomycetes sp. JL221]|nr:hypothetical protein OIO90_004486 [Microbotryomycetes sp. JL221]